MGVMQASNGPHSAGDGQGTAQLERELADKGFLADVSGRPDQLGAHGLAALDDLWSWPAARLR